MRETVNGESTVQAMQEKSLTVRRYPHPKAAGFPRLLAGVCLSVALLVAIATAGAAEKVEEPEQLKNIPGPIKLMLPPVLYAVPGVETNVYFDNVVLAINAKNYAYATQRIRYDEDQSGQGKAAPG